MSREFHLPCVKERLQRRIIFQATALFIPAVRYFYPQREKETRYGSSGRDCSSMFPSGSERASRMEFTRTRGERETDRQISEQDTSGSVVTGE